jgi:hypothetical protein
MTAPQGPAPKQVSTGAPAAGAGQRQRSAALLTLDSLVTQDVRSGLPTKLNQVPNFR